jgi:hypothetical protein
LTSSLLVVALALAAAETDPYYAWYVHVPDGADAINARLNADFTSRLAQVNRSPGGHTCNDVASALLAPYWTTGTWFVIGATKDWGFSYRPANSTERAQTFSKVTIYRKRGLLPFGVFVPVDPTIRVGDVTFGTDKISHFLNNSWRYWETYRAARAQGLKEEDALIRAIDRGVAQEAGILGSGVSGAFSYADLESNYQGLDLIRSWCERGELALRDGRWTLSAPFDIRRWVNPCWDEGWYVTAFDPLTGGGVIEAMTEACPIRQRAHVKAQRAAYRKQTCVSFSVQVLDERIRSGELPDPTPFTVEAICGDQPGRIIGSA